MTPRAGQVVTFYSYKGGTGRTMALANVGWILAANGYRVLVADWDLESPGLHRFFGPFVEPEQVVSSGGVMDLIGEYEWATTELDPDRPADWHREYAKIEKYAFSVGWDHFPDGGGLDILLAGQHNPNYTANVTGLDWDTFYRLGGAEFVDALRDDMKRRYDYVLIDSRTGISDVAEICTLHLPDVLVDCFTLSQQGIDGAHQIAARVADYEGMRSRRVLPVPMRVDEGEKAKADAGRAMARRRFAGLPLGMTDAERRRYWLTIEVPYKSFYAYEETLATFGDEPGARNTLLSAYETLTGYITAGRVTRLPPMDESLRTQTAARFHRRPAVSDAGIVLRYAPEDQAWADWVHAVLAAAGVRVADLGAPPPPDPRSRDLLLVSESFAGRYHQPSSMVLYLDDRTPLVGVPRGHSAYLAEPTAEAAVDRLLQLVGVEPFTSGGSRAVRLPRYPGEAPQVFRAPRRNARFTGRAELLRRLRLELRAAGRDGTAVALRGGGGIGKTQLAVEYAHRYRGAYDIIWWIDADQPRSVAARFAELGEALGLATPETPEALRQWLSRTERRADGEPVRWLLVFDDLDGHNTVEELLPHGNGHILLTGRDTGWSEVARPFGVDGFDLAESVQHLRQRVGADRIGAQDAERLARAVDNHPSLVAAAGAWLADTGARASDYLAELDRAGPVGGVGTDVWEPSLQRLRRDSPGAFRLLQLLSMIAPEVPLELLYGDGLAGLIAPHDRQIAAQLADRVPARSIAVGLVQRLNRLGLVTFDQEVRQLRVHRLLPRVVVLSQMSDRERGDIRHDADLLLNGSQQPVE